MRTPAWQTKGLSTFLYRILSMVMILTLMTFPFETGYGKEKMKIGDDTYSALTEELIRTSLAACNDQVVWLDGIELQSAPLLCIFYSQNNYKPAWTNGNELTNEAKEILLLLSNTFRYGIDPLNLCVEELERYVYLLTREDKAGKSVKVRAGFEFLLTNSVFSLMLHLTHGAEFATSKDAFLVENKVIGGFPGYLSEALAMKQIRKAILILQPESKEYSEIQREMELIITGIDRKDHILLRPDNSVAAADRIHLLSYIFLQHGIIKNGANLNDPEIFSVSVMEFQRSFDLRITGTIDKATGEAAYDLARTRYTELAGKLEEIRKKTHYSEIPVCHNF
jgi:predicted type IV restriction endonuclease